MPGEEDIRSSILRIEDNVINSPNDRDAWWDFTVSGFQQKMFISNNISGTVMTFKENGDCGIGNTAPDAKFHIGNGQYANPINFQLQNDEGKLEIGIAKSAWDFAPESKPGNAVFRVSGDENSMVFILRKG